jgi:ureidoglycolate lyase
VILHLETLTAAAVAPFGDVLIAPELPGRIHTDGALANLRPGAAPSLSFTCKAPATLPLASTTMERHPHSSQSFVPMRAGRWLVVVAPADSDGRPDMAGARAFLAKPDHGVTYGAGVWHHPFTVLDEAASFAVFMWKDGTAADDEFVAVAPFEVRP